MIWLNWLESTLKELNISKEYLMVHIPWYNETFTRDAFLDNKIHPEFNYYANHRELFFDGVNQYTGKHYYLVWNRGKKWAFHFPFKSTNHPSLEWTLDKPHNVQIKRTVYSFKIDTSIKNFSREDQENPTIHDYDWECGNCKCYNDMLVTGWCKTKIDGVERKAY